MVKKKKKFILQFSYCIAQSIALVFKKEERTGGNIYLFSENKLRFQNFSFSNHSSKGKRLTRGDVSKLLDGSEDKCKDTDSSTPDSNDAGIDHINEISDHEFSDDGVTDKFCQTQTSISDLYISRTKRKCGIFIQIVIHLTGSMLCLHNILWQKPGLFCFVKRINDGILFIFLIVVRQYSFEVVCYVYILVNFPNKVFFFFYLLSLSFSTN